MDTTVGPAKPEAPRLREEGGLSSLPNFQGILRGKRRKGGKGKEEYLVKLHFKWFNVFGL